MPKKKLPKCILEKWTCTNKLKGIRKYGWRANMGTKGIYDELFISAHEMS